MAEQRHLGFFGWFFRSFAAALGALFGLLCGAAALGGGYWYWQGQHAGGVDVEMAAPHAETELVIETDVDLDFGDDLLPETEPLLPETDASSAPVSTKSPSPRTDSENKRVVTNPNRTRR